MHIGLRWTSNTPLLFTQNRIQIKNANIILYGKMWSISPSEWCELPHQQENKAQPGILTWPACRAISAAFHYDRLRPLAPRQIIWYTEADIIMRFLSTAEPAWREVFSPHIIRPAIAMTYITFCAVRRVLMSRISRRHYFWTYTKYRSEVYLEWAHFNINRRKLKAIKIVIKLPSWIASAISCPLYAISNSISLSIPCWVSVILAADWSRRATLHVLTS